MAPFKVIIVGGSVAGLTLANMFEQSGIDFVVLEKHETLAPEIGACLGFVANGLRILDQLGCYGEIKKLSQPLTGLDTYDELGKPIGKMPEIGTWMEELLGYRNENLDRRQVIEVLHENLRNKSKVQTSCKVSKIENSANGVQVELEDGTTYDGDIVIGADGIHSRVLQEMQRHAEIDNPGSNTFSKDCFKCTYKALVGIAKSPEAIPQDQGFKNSREGRSYLFVGGRDGKIYFSLFVRNEEITQGHAIPRYNEKDREALAALCKDDVVYPGATFGEIYQNRTCSTLLPVEEGMLQTCFYKRMVLVGDSWHKSTPLFGQGGNNAVVSSAYLVNGLLSVVEGDQSPDEDRLREVFLDYQQTRGPENLAHIIGGQMTQAMEAFASPLFKFIQLSVVPRFSNQIKWNALAGAHASLWTLRNLPVPSRQGLIPSRNETRLLSHPRSKVTDDGWKVIFVAIALGYSILYWLAGFETAQSATKKGEMVLSLGLPFSKIQDLYFHISVTAVMSVIAIESYRPGFVLKPLSSSLPWGILSLLLGWQTVAPIYFGLFALTTGTRDFYYPCVRMIDPAMLNVLPFAYLMTYAVPMMLTFAHASPSFPTVAWHIAHILFPIITYLLERIVGVEPTIDVVRKDEHVKPLKRFITMASALQLGGLLVLEKPLIWRLITFLDSEQIGTLSVQDARIIFLEIAITSFTLFAYSDIRRVRATDLEFAKALFCGLAISLLTSPAIALLVFWGFREVEWANASRKRMVKNCGES